jgi:hypothetical protein
MYVVELLQLSVYRDLSTQNHHFPSHDLPSILLEHLLLRSGPMLHQALPLLNPQTSPLRVDKLILDILRGSE